jgi:hypothetical protein
MPASTQGEREAQRRYDRCVQRYALFTRASFTRITRASFTRITRASFTRITARRSRASLRVVHAHHCTMKPTAQRRMLGPDST